MIKSLFSWKVWINVFLSIVFLFLGIWITFRWLDSHTNHGEEIEIPDITNLHIDKAEQVLKNVGLSYEVDSLSFDPKFKSLQVVKVDPLVGSRVKMGRPIRVYINPKTWAEVEIPDIIENYKHRAFDKLSLVGLKVRDTIYEPSTLKDAVVRILYDGKIVNPGKLIPRSSYVDVVIGIGPIKNILIPNLVGKTLGEAQKIINDSYFDIGISYDEDDKSVSESSLIVFYQNPIAGSVADQGVRIDLWSSKKTQSEMGDKIEKLNEIYHRDSKSKQLSTENLESSEIPYISESNEDNFSDKIEDPEHSKKKIIIE